MVYRFYLSSCLSDAVRGSWARVIDRSWCSALHTFVIGTANLLPPEAGIHRRSVMDYLRPLDEIECKETTKPKSLIRGLIIHSRPVCGRLKSCCGHSSFLPRSG